jgi:very-long-chain enoyl-CoA reductase
MTMSVITVQAGKKQTDIKIPLSSSVGDLKAAFAKSASINVHRISLKAGETRLDRESNTLSTYGLADGSVVQFKDLGPQIGYRTVFLVEYFGPMVFVLLYALRPTFLYGAKATDPYNWVAKLDIACWVAHFLKREFETVFVHKFSRPTMPLSNLFKNCTYYWTFGAVIGYPLCSPSYAAPGDFQVLIGFAIFLLSEIGNLICHIMLSNLRAADGSTKRPIPTGFLFNYVACPNYTFEIMSWVGFSIMTQIPFAYLFTAVGLYQMGDWALKKHREYKKVYDKEYTSLRRKAIIPFVI